MFSKCMEGCESDTCFEGWRVQWVSNYRPVCVLNNFAKVFEMSLYRRLFPLLKCSISQYQHGFFEGRSTITNLTYFTQFISNTVDINGQVDVIYADFSKAFDRISHEMVLTKLSNFGCSPGLVEFFHSYLSARRYAVNYGGYTSDYYTAVSGVPQGSNLGPLLFLIFINDVVCSINCNKLLFADDLKIFSVINEYKDCHFLQRQIELLSGWCESNGLPLNIKKCNVMTFTRKLNPLIFPYTVGEIPLARVEGIKDLGVYFDPALSFSRHVDSVIKTAFKSLGFIIRSSRSFSNISTIKVLYFAYVRSRLEYASVVWSPFYEVHKASLERVQRRFLKYLYFRSHGVYPVRGYDHVLLLDEFKLTSLEFRRTLNSVIFLHKLVNGAMDCSDILCFLELYVPREASRCNNIFRCPKARTNIMLKSPIYVMTGSWNRIAGDCDIFSSSLGAVSLAVRNLYS